jgi:hypothetical protein
MSSFTLEDLIDEVRELGDVPNSSVFTDAFLTKQLNKSVGRYCDILDATHEGYRDTTAAGVTVANTATVSLPSGFLRMKAVDILVDGKYRALRRMGVRETYGHDEQTDRPRGYIVRANLVELFPTPNAVYTLRFRYTPEASKLSDLADSIDIPNGWEAFVIYGALLTCGIREERPLGEWMAVTQQAEAAIKAAAENRNDAEPEYIPMPGEEQDVFW